MSENLNTKPQQEENAGCLGIGFSFMFPIVGVVLYFMEKNTVSNANAYLYAAGASFVLGLVLSSLG